MGWRIAVDPEKAIAVLYSEDPLYALGPAIEADTPDEAYEALNAFACACDPEPHVQPTIALMAQWQSYVQYLAELQQQALTASQGSPGAWLDPETGEPLPVVSGPGSGSEDAPEAAPDPTAGPGDSSSPGGPIDLPGPTGSIPDDADPIAGQQQVCWCCGGSGKLNLAGTQTDCNVCQGSGLVEAVAK